MCAWQCAVQDQPRAWKRFYDFWNDFQSWRDPATRRLGLRTEIRLACSHCFAQVMLAQKAGEEICDLAEAECREERWKMYENVLVAGSN